MPKPPQLQAESPSAAVDHLLAGKADPLQTDQFATMLFGTGNQIGRAIKLASAQRWRAIGKNEGYAGSAWDCND